MEGDLAWGGEHTIQCVNVLQNCTPETYVILLTNATPISSIKVLKRTLWKKTIRVWDKFNIVIEIT